MLKMKIKKVVVKWFKIMVFGKLKYGVVGKCYCLISYNGKYICQNCGMEVVVKVDIQCVIKKFLLNGLKQRFELNLQEGVFLWFVYVIRCQ